MADRRSWVQALLGGYFLTYHLDITRDRSASQAEPAQDFGTWPADVQRPQRTASCPHNKSRQ